MSKYVYPAIFTSEPDGGYSVYFPDLEGCYTCGDTLADALFMAEDALALILYGYEKEMRSFTPPMKDYILIYSYDKNLNDEAEYNHIKKYAEKHNLKIVSVGYYHKWCKSIDASPFELLGWIKNANLVVTDTFHGSVMSIICNTPAVVKLRGNQNKLRFLLSEYGLLDRTILDFSEMESVADKSVDFANVNAAIQERRAASMKFLDDALAGCR